LKSLIRKVVGDGNSEVCVKRFRNGVADIELRVPADTTTTNDLEATLNEAIVNDPELAKIAVSEQNVQVQAGDLREEGTCGNVMAALECKVRAKILGYAFLGDAPMENVPSGCVVSPTSKRVMFNRASTNVKCSQKAACLCGKRDERSNGRSGLLPTLSPDQEKEEYERQEEEREQAAQELERNLKEKADEELRKELEKIDREQEEAETEGSNRDEDTSNKCEDKIEGCAGYASDGLCTDSKLKGYMKENCCVACRGLSKQSEGGEEEEEEEEVCEDRLTGLLGCSFYSFLGHCTHPNHKEQMMKDCCKSCTGENPCLYGGNLCSKGNTRTRRANTKIARIHDRREVHRESQ